MNQFEPSVISGTEDARSVYFSPDSQWLLFNADGTWNKARLSGGPPVTLCDGSSAGATWGSNDTVVFGSANSGLSQVSAAGGMPRPLTTLAEGEVSHTGPHFLPGERAVLFTINAAGTRMVAVESLETGERKVLIEGSSAKFLPTGHLIFARDDTLWAVPFDANGLELHGEPVPVVEEVVINANGFARYSIGDDGTLVFAPTGGTAAATLVRVDRDGRSAPLIDEPADYWYPRVAPDGRRVAVGIGSEIWVIDLERLTRTRLTFGQTSRVFPFAWMRDGARVTFASPDNGIYSTGSDGSGQPELQLNGEYPQWPTSWSPDGQTLAFYVNHPETARDLWMLPSDDDRSTAPFLVTPFQERAPSFSPDGRWVVYVSDESGQEEVYVQPYPGPGLKIAISTSGGSEPVWSADGRELFYRNGAEMMVVEVVPESTLRVSTPRLLFTGADYQLNSLGAGGRPNPNYDVLSDGQGFVMIEGPGGPPHVSIVLNWFEELKARVPVN